MTKEKDEDDEIVVKLQYMDLDINSINGIVSNCRDFITHRENWDHDDYGKDRDAELIKKYNVENIQNIPNKDRYLKGTNGQVRYIEDDFVDSLKSIQFRFQTQGQTVVFFRKFTPQKILSHGKRTWKAISGVLKLNEDNIVEVPIDYDCCKYKDDMIIFHPDNFEDLFDYHEIHEKFHKEIFGHFEKKADYEIIDYDKIKEQTLTHPQKLRKLPAIKEKGMYLWTFAQIEAFLKFRPTPTVVADHKKKTLKFKNVYAMMDFFNDAHLDSKATNLSYLAQHKSVEK